MMIDLFCRQAASVGAECHLAGDRQQALDRVVSLLLQEGVQDLPDLWAVWAADAGLREQERLEIERRVPGARFDVSPRTASRALAGISWMDWGVAETGTLIGNASAVDLRLVSTLPPIHIAILPAGRIVADMAAALARLDVRRSPFVAAITGPSRTADIERVLTIGVHGPRRLLIVLIRGEEDGGKAQ